MKALAPLFFMLLAGRCAAADVMGSVVSSKEWRVRRAPKREEEFVGDVRYKAGPNRFSSDWALFQHEAKTWKARGRVVMVRTMDSGDVLTSKGEEASFDQNVGRGWLDSKKRVTFERAPADGSPADEAEAGRVEWSGREEGTLLGGVHLWGPRLEGWADRADFEQAGEVMTLTGGRPVLVKGEGLGADWIGALKADSVSAKRTGRRVSAKGKVTGWLEFRDVPEAPR